METIRMAATGNGSAKNISPVPGAELVADAEAELSAFFAAVQGRWGSSLAGVAAGLWLHVFGSTEISTCDPRHDLRKITINSAGLLAAQIAQQRKCESLPALGAASKFSLPPVRVSLH